MNSFFDQWNALGANWADWLLSGAMHSAWLLGLVYGIWVLLGKRRTSHLGYALFLLPLIPLVLPPVHSFEFSSPSLSGWTDAFAAGPLAIPGDPIAESSSVPTHLTGHPSTVSDLDASAITQELSANSKTGMPVVSWPAWGFLAWALVLVGMIVRFVQIQFRTSRLLRSSTPLPEHDAIRVQAAMGRRFAGSNVQVLQCPGISGPAAWGFRHRMILLPPNMINRLDDQQLAWVLRHELAHHTRRDLPVSAVQRLVLLTWFFNPLVWWLCRNLDHLRECACDETAQAQTQMHGKICATALLEVAAQSHRHPTSQFALQSLHQSKQSMKNRIRRLMHPNRTAKAGLAPVALPLLLLMTVLSVTGLKFTSPKQEAKRAIVQAQSWLIDQQMPDGHWPTGPGSDKSTGEFNAIGVTGFTLMCLEQTSDPKLEDRRAQAVQRGLKYLENSLKENTAIYGGIFGGPQDYYSMGSHAIATQAWLRAHRNAKGKEWRKTAQLAIDAILNAQNPYSAWRFEHVPNGDNDSFITSLMLRTLAEANAQGFEIPKTANLGGFNYLKEMTDPVTGRIGYQKKGSLDERLVNKKDSHPVKYTELYTAISLLALAENGVDLTDSEASARGVALISAKKPVWKNSNASVDYYYWYFGSETMAQVGGKFQASWRAALHTALLPKQVGHKKDAGSWPAVDAWGDEFATVHSTAIAILALQASIE